MDSQQGLAVLDCQVIYWLWTQQQYSTVIKVRVHEWIHCSRRCLVTCKLVMFSCGNLFSKTNRTWEFIFEEKALFKISENKNLSKIASYTVNELVYKCSSLYVPMWGLSHASFHYSSLVQHHLPVIVRMEVVMHILNLRYRQYRLIY